MNTLLVSLRQSRPYRAAITAALLTTAVLLAWLATPLRAAVIDDFSGPKKFALYGINGVPEYELNGELHCVVPTIGSAAAFWYWPSTYELPEGQPVEFRVDAVTLNYPAAVAELAVTLPTLPTAPRATIRGYCLYWTPDRVALNKVYDQFSSFGFDAAHAHSFEPVTLSLTLTRQGSSLKLGTKVSRRGEPEQILFSQEVTDTPARDFTDDNGAPPEGPVAGVGVVCSNLVEPSAVIDAVLDNLECSADPRPMTLGIQRHTGTEVRFQWPNIGVLLEAEAPAGPWKPWPGVVSLDAGAYHVVIPASGKAAYYRLAGGDHILDLFHTRWDAAPRKIAPPVPNQSDVPAFTMMDGRGRIRGTGQRNADFLLYHGGFSYPAKGDAIASVDLVDWAEAMEEGAAFGIVLRANPGAPVWHVPTHGLPTDRYAGLLTFKKEGLPSESVLSLTGPGGEVLTSQSFPAVDPAKQHRLRFWAVGDRLTLELFSLDDLGNETPVKTCEATDGRVVEGMDAMYGTKSSGSTYDVTIDRYLFSGVLQ